MKIGLVYGSTTGNTTDAAEMIRDLFHEEVDSYLDISDTDLAVLPTFDVLFIGVSTWNIGELQQDWDEVFRKLDPLDFTGTKLVFFGQGDQKGYPENFQDAMGILRTRMLELGATAEVGHWPTEGYEFEDSLGLVDGKFVGLALDEDNQAELTEERIDVWCEQVRGELGLG